MMGIALFYAPLAAALASRSVWFYRLADAPRWCSVTTKAGAETVAENDAFASGESAWMQFRGGRIDRIVVMTQSEDAYVEDSYRFAPDLRLLSVERRGHYIDDPLFGVTFLPDRSGKLRLTAKTRAARSREERAGHTTYFLDWPLYRRFADFPFAPLIVRKPAIVIVQPCPT